MSSPQIVDIQETLNENPLSHLQRTVVVMCFAVMLLDGYDTAIMAFVAPAISHAWHVPPGGLGVAISAALFGVALGALIAGPLADRFGRKAVLAVSVFFFGICTLASAFAPDLTFLAGLRFLTGIGLGAAMPNAATLTSEYAPARSRATMVGILFCGFTAGSAGGGLLAGYLIPHFGWPSTFVIGGILPVLLAVAMLILLPESLQFRAVQGGERNRRSVIATLSAIERRTEISPDALVQYPETEGGKARRTLLALFSSGLASGTLALWATYFLGLLVIFLLRSWLPMLMNLAGQSIERAAMLSALFDVGGTFGALIVARIVDRRQSDQVVSVAYLAAAAAILVLAPFSNEVTLLAAGVFLLGFLLTGPQACLPSMAAKFYPTTVRATGVAWVLGIGRIGGIVGALSGGTMLQFGWPLSAILAALAAPAALAAFIIWAHARQTSKRSKQGGAGDKAH